MADPTSTSQPSSTISSTPLQSCITMTPQKNGYVPVEACNALWAYSPSFPLALLFATLFGLLTLAHLFFAILFRKRFCSVIIMASLWQFLAFTLRALASRDQQNEGFAIASQLLFLLAPLWINAFVYMTAGRLVWFLHPEKKIWKFKALSLGKWFVWLDVFSFGVQATGGLMLSPGNSAETNDLGKKIYMSGLGVQEFFILLFLGLLVKFQIDVGRLDSQGSLAQKIGRRAWWKWLVYALYTNLALITMRIIFRLAEFSGGMDPVKNKLPFIEAYALWLDAFPMVLAIFALAAVHPGFVLKGEESEFPSRKERKAEEKEKKRAKKEEKRARKEGNLLAGVDDQFHYIEMGKPASTAHASARAV